MLRLNRYVVSHLKPSRQFAGRSLFYHRPSGNYFTTRCNFVTSNKALILLFSLIADVNRFGAWSPCFSLLCFCLINRNHVITECFLITLNKLVGALSGCARMLYQRLCKSTFTASVRCLILVGNILNVSLISQDPKQLVFLFLLSRTLCCLFTLLRLVLLKDQIHTLMLVGLSNVVGLIYIY